LPKGNDGDFVLSLKGKRNETIAFEIHIYAVYEINRGVKA
jgi:hypothetical protein